MFYRNQKLKFKVHTQGPVEIKDITSIIPLSSDIIRIDVNTVQKEIEYGIYRGANREFFLAVNLEFDEPSTTNSTYIELLEIPNSWKFDMGNCSKRCISLSFLPTETNECSH